MFFGLNICGGGVKTLQTFPGATALIVGGAVQLFNKILN